MEKFDAIIIGSGQAGNPLAKKLSQEGMRVALVEQAFIGGTCINYGCTPTKTLVGTAKIIAQARQAETYGVICHKKRPDYKVIHQRTNKVVTDFRKGLENSLMQDSNITIIQGKARFSGQKTIQVASGHSDDKSLTAELIFINTGTQPRIPGIEGLQSVPFLTSRTILKLENLPRHLLIVGGGYIALEFAQIYRRLGSDVTIIEQSPRLLPKEDDDASLTIRQVLEAEGIRIITGATVRQVKKDKDEPISIDVLSGEKSEKISGSHLLVAAGTVPSTGYLDLSKTGVQLDDRGFISVNDHLETTEAGIFALGDVKGGPAFTHVSYHDYLVLSDYLFGQKEMSIRHRLIPYCLFTDPELGRIGLTERDAAQMGLDFSVAKMKTSAIARAIESGETTGFLKAIVDNQTREILGVTVLCAGSGELMSLLQVAMMGGIKYDQLRDTMFAHPTYAEAINNLFSAIHLKQGDQS